MLKQPEILLKNTPVPHLFHLTPWFKAEPHLSRSKEHSVGSSLCLFVSFSFFFAIHSHMCIFWSLFTDCHSLYLPRLLATSSAQHYTDTLLWDSMKWVRLLWLCWHCYCSPVFLRIRLFESTEKCDKFHFHIQSNDQTGHVMIMCVIRGPLYHSFPLYVDTMTSIISHFRANHKQYKGVKDEG